SGLNKDEIDRMIREAASHAEDDKKKRELADARNQLDGYVYQTEKALGDHGASLDAGVRGEVESALGEAKKALESNDASAMRASADTLQRASHKLAEAMYAKASQQPGGGAPPKGDGAADSKSKDGKDDVVEAEFEEVKE